MSAAGDVPSASGVSILAAEDVPAVVSVLSEAFHDYPVMRFHLHLNMIGVRRHQQGRRLGAQLLDYLHASSAADPTSAGVSLSTEVESNVSLYRRFGYRVLGSAPVASAFTTWGMFRPDVPPPVQR